MTSPIDPILSLWESEGHRHASALDACAGAVVIGERPATAAEVALGIARYQARRRRVAVADAVGELAPLEDLVPMDAPYGLIDSFFYGVSLNKVAYPVDPARNLIIFPSGVKPIDHEGLLSNSRWTSLLNGFRSVDGLLLIVAPAESSALSALIQMMDGVVLVGNIAAAPGTRVLAHARLPAFPARLTPAPGRPVPVPPAPVSPIPAGSASPPPADPVLDSAPADEPPMVVHEPTPPPEGATELVPPWARYEEFTDPGPKPPGSALAISFWFLIIAGAIAVAALLTWATTSMLSRGDGANDPLAPRPAASARDTPAHSAVAPPLVVSPSPVVAKVDSAPYAVALSDVSSETGANTELEQKTGRGVLAVTYAAHPRTDGGTAFLVLAGAFHDSASADSLLRSLRSRHLLAAGTGHVTRVPFAVAVQRGISREQASMFVHGYLSKGFPVYPLLQSDGSATLYAGAFPDIEQAQPLVTSFRANGEKPAVTIRTGRAF